MKNTANVFKIILPLLGSGKATIPLAALLMLSFAGTALAQGTAFTYQGHLENGGNPATGLYDFTSALYNASSGGAQVGSTITLPAVPVTNGLFSVLLDFGAVFNGTTYWLQIGVRSNGVGSYVALNPRQELTPTPYAITAENLDGTLLASQLTGILPSTLLSGTYPDAVNLNNAGNSFSGSGSGLTSLNASQLTSGTVPDARLSANVALLSANQTFAGRNTFYSGLGTGRFLVNSLGTSAVDTNLFTGLSLQYSQYEGAIMSAFDDLAGGAGYLSFYTKAHGSPITKQMIIDYYGGLAIDQGDHNDGGLDHTSLTGIGLTFGVGSGEGLASKRTTGGNQYGLDFYSGFVRRMSLSNGGNLWVQDNTIYLRRLADGNHGLGWYGPGKTFAGAAPDGPVLFGYSGGALGTEQDGTEKIALTWNSRGTVGIGSTNTPAGQLDVEGTANTANGIYVTTAYTNGNAIYAIANSGLSAYAVWASSTSGYGVVAESTTGTGIRTYSSSGSALTIAGGAIHVSGAGIGTSTAAFIHVATAANASGTDGTAINNSLCNGDANAILIVTPNLTPYGVRNNHPIGVWYNASISKWVIFNQDAVTIPINAAFNVLVIKN